MGIWEKLGTPTNYHRKSVPDMITTHKCHDSMSEVFINQFNIGDMLKVEDPNDVCSKKNITINSSTDYIESTNTGDIDDEYDLDF